MEKLNEDVLARAMAQQLDENTGLVSLGAVPFKTTETPPAPRPDDRPDITQDANALHEVMRGRRGPMSAAVRQGERRRERKSDALNVKQLVR